MAFPTVVITAQGHTNSNTSNHVIDTSGISSFTIAGDMILIVFSATKQSVPNFATTNVTDWNCVGMTYDPVATITVRSASAIYYKIATLSNQTYPITITTQDQCYSSWIIYLIRGANVVDTKFAIGRSSFPDSPSLNINETTTPDVLWFIAESTYYNNKNGGPNIPIGYTNYMVEQPDNQQGGATWSYRRALAATVEDPGVVTYGSPGVHDSWISWTIAVYDVPVDANFPTIEATNTFAYASPVSTHTINLPQHNAGDLLLVIFSISGNQQIFTLTNTSKKWNQMVSFDALDFCTSAVFWKVSNGVERLEVISTNGARSSHIAYRIINANHVTVSTSAGIGNAVSTASLTYNEQIALNVKVFSAAAATGNYSVINPPVNYNKTIMTHPGSSLTGPATISSYRNYNSTTETPGAYSYNAPFPTSWVGWTIAVYKKPEIYPKVISTTSGSITTSNSPDINYPGRNYTFPITTLPTNVAGSTLIVIVQASDISANDLIVDTSISGSNWIKLTEGISVNESHAIFYKTADASNVLTLRRGFALFNGNSYITYAIQDADITTIAASSFVQNSSSFIFAPPNQTSPGNVADKYLYIASASSRDNFNSTLMVPYNFRNYISQNEGNAGTIISAHSVYFVGSSGVGSSNPFYSRTGSVSSYVASTIIIKYKAPEAITILPQSGNLSIKSAATVARSIAQAVDGNNTGPKSLRKLSQKASVLYGLTVFGGSSNNGVLFKYDILSNSYTVLVNFNSNPNGSMPRGSLLYHDNSLYGMTSNEGLGSGTQYGTLFKYDIVNNVFTKLYQFRGDSQNEGSYPQDSLIFYNEKLYGLTRQGGLSGDYGTLFEYDLNTSVLTYKVSFFSTGPNSGQEPLGSLTIYNNKFYGMTFQGGTGFDGTIFEYDPNTNIFTKKKDLDINPGDPRNPYGSLTVFKNKLYGMCSSGGTNNDGTIFEYDPNADVLTVKFSFDTITTGGSPYGSLTLYNDKFYGLTRIGGPSTSNGTIFEYDPNTDTFTHKFNIEDANNLSRPLDSFVLANEKLYATLSEGGLSNYGGIIEYDPNTNNVVVLRQFGAPGNNSLGTAPGGNLTPYNGAFYKEKGNNINTLPEQISDGGNFENGAVPAIFSQSVAYTATGLSITNSTDIAYTGTRSGKILKSFGSLSMGQPEWDGGCMVAWARLDNPVIGKSYKASMYIYVSSTNPIANDDHSILFTITNKRYIGAGGNNYSDFEPPNFVTNTFETVISNTTLSISTNKGVWKKVECIFRVNSLYNYVGIYDGYDENMVPIFLIIKGPSGTTTINGNGILYIDQIDIREIEAKSLLEAPYGMREFYGYGNIINTNVSMSLDAATYFSSTSGPYRGSSQTVNLSVANTSLFGDSSFGVRISKALQIFSNSTAQSAKASIFNQNTNVINVISSSNGFGISNTTSQEDLTIFGSTLLKFNMSVEELGNNASVNAFARITISSVWTNGAINPIITTSSIALGTQTSTI